MVVLFFVALAAVVVAMSATQVQQGYNFTIERFGRYRTTLEPGLDFIVPFFDRVGRKVNMMERMIEVPSQEVITKDNVMLKVDGIVYFQVLDAAKAAYEVANLEYAVMNLIMTNIRTVLGAMDLDESLSKRDQINHSLLRVVDEATHPWGLKVTRIEIKDIAPPRDIIDAMARQMKAEREKRATILEAEGQRQSAILRAEGEKQAAVLQAEGLKEATFRTAEARERSAQAEAEATRMVSESIAKGDVNAINYFVALKYVEALHSIGIAPNQKVIFMPMETAGVLASIGGIGELAKEAFGKRGA
jgi:regulator of protease activity HflC (stomatin/prohibitin superfamily)